MGIVSSFCESKRNMEALLESPIPSHLMPLLDVICEEKPDEIFTEQETIEVECGGSAIMCEQRERPEERSRFRTGH